MDGQQFDRLARNLASGASRRRVLAGLAGAALGALGLHRAGAQPVEGGAGAFCGGITGTPCPAGFACVDAGGDGCDPTAGGADCAGVCQPVPTTSNCAAILCLEGTDCCENCGGICVPAGTPCSDDLCGDPGAVPCNQVLCGPDQYCCNFSCSICAPVGGACTDQFCGEPCGPNVCGPEEFCCNESCGICAPVGGFCTQQVCDEPCAGVGEPCGAGCCEGSTCEASTGVCAVDQPPVTCQRDADCVDGDEDPCTAATCVDGTCSFAIVDCAPGFACCDNGQCCPTRCQTDADCPPDPTGCNSVACTDGRCVSTTRACGPDDRCVDEGEACGDGVACCGDLRCRRGDGGGRTCRAEPSVAPAPTATAGSRVVRLPSTGGGGGTRSSEHRWLAPLALLAAGVTAVGVRLRNAASGDNVRS